MFAETACKQQVIWEPTAPHARETLLIDFENSPHLEHHYLNWKKQLPSFDARIILESLLWYLRTEVFDPNIRNKAEVLRSLHACELPLDDFVVHKIGVCRHFCLAAYFFLEKLKTEHLIAIYSMEIVRKEVKNSRHSYLELEFEDGSFHFDPYWGILSELNGGL
jgi:hypothetical protein